MRHLFFYILHWNVLNFDQNWLPDQNKTPKFPHVTNISNHKIKTKSISKDGRVIHYHRITNKNILFVMGIAFCKHKMMSGSVKMYSLYLVRSML